MHGGRVTAIAIIGNRGILCDTTALQQLCKAPQYFPQPYDPRHRLPALKQRGTPIWCLHRHNCYQRRRQCITLASPRLQTAKLPNGLEAAYVSRNDLLFLYSEIFEGRFYLQQGITLPSGGTVVDVGANIGLFSLFAAEALGEQGKVIAAEPIPRIFSALQHNVASHSKFAQERGIGVASVHTHQVGVSDGTAVETDFTFYPRAAGWSSMRPDTEEVQQAMDLFLDRTLGPSRRATSLHNSAGIRAGKLIRRILPDPIVRSLTRLFVRRMLGGAQTVSCRLTTVSELAALEHLERIDLLKIDVERAELEVLRGISRGCWALVRQIVMEVHDIDDQLAAAEALLRQHDFSHIAHEQSDELKGSALYTVYARR